MDYDYDVVDADVRLLCSFPNCDRPAYAFEKGQGICHWHLCHTQVIRQRLKPALDIQPDPNDEFVGRSAGQSFNLLGLIAGLFAIALVGFIALVIVTFIIAWLKASYLVY